VTTTAPQSRTAQRGVRTTSATRIVASVFGVLAGLVGIEHGVGAMLQGSVRPAGLVIESWPYSAAMEVLAGEPAMTIIPDLLVSGILAVAVGLAIVIWSAWFVDQRHGGLVLIALSAFLLLIGGGFGPPLVGIIVGVAVTMASVEPHRRPGAVSRALGRLWPGFTAAGVLGYLLLMPGMVIIYLAFDVTSASAVSVLPVLSFVSLVLALVAARAHDRIGERPHGWAF
jgi:hypothetical protein